MYIALHRYFVAYASSYYSCVGTLTRHFDHIAHSSLRPSTGATLTSLGSFEPSMPDLSCWTGFFLTLPSMLLAQRAAPMDEVTALSICSADALIRLTREQDRKHGDEVEDHSDSAEAGISQLNRTSRTEKFKTDLRSVCTTALLDGSVSSVLVVAFELEVSGVVTWPSFESVVAEEEDGSDNGDQVEGKTEKVSNDVVLSFSFDIGGNAVLHTVLKR